MLRLSRDPSENCETTGPGNLNVNVTRPMTMRMPAGLAGLMLAAALVVRSAEPAPSQPVAATGPAPSEKAAKAVSPAELKSKSSPAAEGTPGKPASRVKREADGDVVITLDASTQKLMGLQVASLASASLNPEIKGYGRVLDASTLMSLAGELALAQVAQDASQAEWKRLKTLAGQNNVSERALQAAESAAAHEQALVDSARLRLLASWGAPIAARKDLPAFARSLGGLESVLVEIDLPAGAPMDFQPTAARLQTLAEGAKPVAAKWIGAAPAVDPLSQGRGFWFLVSPNPARLTPGQAVTGWLDLPGEAVTGVALPREAILRQDGATWVYLQTSENSFQRKEVALDRLLANAWFVRDSFKPGDKVVVAGAQQLLSEERKGPDEAETKD